MMNMGSEKIVVELSEIAKSGLYTSKGGEIEGIAKKGIKVRKIKEGDLEKVRKILSKGEPLSKIVIEQGFLFGKTK